MQTSRLQRKTATVYFINVFHMLKCTVRHFIKLERCVQELQNEKGCNAKIKQTRLFRTIKRCSVCKSFGNIHEK